MGLVVTQVLELPHDLRIGQSFQMMLGHEPDDPRVDPALPTELRNALFRLSPDQQQALGRRLASTRLVFLRQFVRSQMPLQAADLAVGEWVRGLMSEEQWAARIAGLEHAMENLVMAPVTVVAVSRIVPIDRWPTNRDGQDAVMDVELDAGIEFLNDFIVSLSLVARDSRMRPIARGDVPYVLPVIIDAFPMEELRRVGATFLRQIHNHPPATRNEPLATEAVNFAGTLTSAYVNGFIPWFLFYELMQGATTALVEHRFADSAIALGTAAEVLINTTIREVSLLLEEPEERRERLLSVQVGLKNRLTDHVPRYLATQVDLDDPTTPFGGWWASGYALRNRVVHRGERPTQQETAEAWESVSTMTIAIRDALRAQPHTEELGQKLEWGERSERTDWDRRLGLI